MRVVREVKGQKLGEQNSAEEIQSAHKTKPSLSATGFNPFRVNPVNQSFQPAIADIGHLDEDNTNIRNLFQFRSEKLIIQNNTIHLQTSNKSTVLPVRFIQTAQTSQSQTLAQPSFKVKIKSCQT